MKQKLTSLATGELVAVLVFWMNFFLLKKRVDTFYEKFIIMNATVSNEWKENTMELKNQICEIK